MRFCDLLSSRCPERLLSFLDQSSLPQIKLIHSHFVKRGGFKRPIAFYNKLLSVYGKFQRLTDATRLFNQIPQKTVISWTTMIRMYAKNHCNKEALNCFSEMRRSSIQPDESLFSTIIPVCADPAFSNEGPIIHADVLKRGFESNEYVGTALIDMYGKCSRTEYALHVFDGMGAKNKFTWTAMIAAYLQNGLIHEACDMFENVPERDIVVYNIMINGLAQNGFVEYALSLFQEISDPNLPTWNAMLTCLAQNGWIAESIELFQRIPTKSIASWGAIIGGFVQNRYSEEAFGLFRDMISSGMQVNSVTVSNALDACSDLAMLKQGAEAHGQVIRKGYDSEVFVQNSVVDMYCKCGMIDTGFKVFSKMLEKNVVSWTVMISGYALHGQGRYALELFQKMEALGIVPDHVVFIGVLAACNHSGLVGHGFYYFDRMQNHYHISPGLKHYGCMVDLLGRAGHLDQAYDLVSSMPIKPSSVIWGSLLASCTIFKNISLGEIVGKHLLGLDPMNSSHYLSLISLYAAAGRWDDVGKVRKLMRDRNVLVRTGISWIVLKNHVHRFTSGDVSHVQTNEVYAKLDELYEKFRGDEWQLGENHHMLCDWDEQEEETLRHHSEKLAMACGLINTTLDTPLLIFKNLRICRDCHEFTKFVSKIEERKIIIRDTNRFHSFSDGLCSCRDYW